NHAVRVLGAKRHNPSARSLLAVNHSFIFNSKIYSHYENNLRESQHRRDIGFTARRRSAYDRLCASGHLFSPNLYLDHSREWLVYDDSWLYERDDDRARARRTRFA